VGKNLARAISSVISGSKSLARGKSKSVAGSKSKTVSNSVGGSKSESVSESVSKGISFIEGVCKTMGESLSESIAQSRSQTRTQGQSLTFGRSESSQEGETHGMTKSIKAPYMSVDDEARCRSYAFAELRQRCAYVLTRHNGEVAQIRTHDIPFEYDTKLGTRDCVERFLKATRPAPVVLPEKNVFERLEEESMKQQRRRSNEPEGL
jgi:hypothetical protein